MTERWLIQLGAPAILVFLALVHHPSRAQIQEDCSHEDDPNVATSIELRDGETVYRDISKNQTQRYFYRNFNVTTMKQPEKYRKLILNLEPCKGIVYLFIRKNRRCYPNPYSCIDLTDGFVSKKASQCQYTHFMSTIDGSRDGAPTFFEVPLSSTKWFISVFAVSDAAYTLNLLGDIGALPRPKNLGLIQARQLKELSVQLQWEDAEYIPAGVSTTRWYWIYSTLLLDVDVRTNTAVFLRPSKILNTACGLKNNTDRYYERMRQGICKNGKCNATIQGVLPNKRYAFNVVVESERGLVMAYSGIILSTDWKQVKQLTSDSTLKAIGAVAGSVLGAVFLVYFILLGFHGGFDKISKSIEPLDHALTKVDEVLGLDVKETLGITDK
jgi:hypothetical protein